MRDCDSGGLAPRLLSLLGSSPRSLPGAGPKSCSPSRRAGGRKPAPHLPSFGGIGAVRGLLIGSSCSHAVAHPRREMAVAYWMFHAPQSPFPALNMGDAAILYCFVFLYLSAAGPGPWSVDALRGPARR